MGKIKRIQLKRKKYLVPVPGTSPGAQLNYENHFKSEITAHAYDGEQYDVKNITSVSELNDWLTHNKHLTVWIDVRGLDNRELFNYLESELGIHRLVIEDILNVQRPKLDEYEDYMFLTSRSIYVDEEHEVENEQVSFILKEKLLISFQETNYNCLQPIESRLESGKGNIRIGGASYMLYALTDLIIDTYFATIYQLGDELDRLEELIYKKPNKTIVYQTNNIKRILVAIRRAAWPERDKLNDLIRNDSSLITRQTKEFLKDAYDHAMQIIDLIESYKEITTSIIDLNLSFTSNRMNEIMKVLTIISSIFIPLTFIAGIYGMNFAYQDPRTGEVMPKNMPELYSPNGYLYVMAVMIFIAVVQIFFFFRKGWFR